LAAAAAVVFETWLVRVAQPVPIVVEVEVAFVQPMVVAAAVAAARLT
jgi:hypothetical protein